MCNSPNMLADKSLVACRKCGQCRSNRIDEWVGRCIAESKTAVATTFVTLTYGRDQDGNESHERAAILTYSDPQKYFKQLRNRGYPCRYIVIGEHGSKKGRAHWHAIVFWQERVPISMTDYGSNEWSQWNPALPVERAIEWDKRFLEPCWPHGFSHWTTIKYGHEKGSIAYACKYINKDVDDPHAQTKVAMSKRPPIGSDYFIERAQLFVDERISPQDPFYQFPGQAKRKNGNVINFMLRGKLQEIFCDAFVTKWQEQIGGHYPPSKYIDEYLDAKTRNDSGDYVYLGRVDEEKRYERYSGEAIQVMEHRWPMQPPFGHTWRDIHYRKELDAPQFPCVKTEYGDYLYYGENKEGIRGWRSEIPEKNTRQGRGGGSLHPEPVPELTQLGWVGKLAERHVFWISTSVTTLGRYVQAKHQPATGRRVWLQAMTR